MQNQLPPAASNVLSFPGAESVEPQEAAGCGAFFYRAFQENPLPMIVVDRNLAILAANHSYQKLFAEISDRPARRACCLDGLSLAIRSKLQKIHAKRLLTPEAAPDSYRLDLVDNNGNSRVWLLYIEYLRTSQESVISIVDITQHEPAVFDPSPRHEEIQTLFDQSPVITFITNPDGIIEEAGQNLLTATGLKREMLIGRPWTEFLAEAAPEHHQELLQKLKRHTMLENIETRFRFAALLPNERTTLLSARLIRFHDEARLIFTVNDISRIPQFDSDLFHLEDLKVASELAAGVGHEIRNPMTAVRGFIQCLSQKSELDQYQNYFQLMLEELDRANQIITEYLSLTKVKTPQVTVENLNDIIRQILPLLQINALSSNKTIHVDLAPLADFSADANEIRQLLFNLVKNGLEAMTPGKTLTIKTQQRAADTIVLEIQDEGCGIPPELLPKIGTPFFTTKANGTGIGLSICYSITEKNNAVIDIKTSDHGTTFSIAFKLRSF